MIFLPVDCKSTPTADGRKRNGNAAAVHLSAGIELFITSPSVAMILANAFGASSQRISGINEAISENSIIYLIANLILSGLPAL